MRKVSVLWERLDVLCLGSGFSVVSIKVRISISPESNTSHLTSHTSDITCHFFIAGYCYVNFFIQNWFLLYIWSTNSGAPKVLFKKKNINMEKDRNYFI